jgi:hypothetical protein
VNPESLPGWILPTVAAASTVFFGWCIWKLKRRHDQFKALSKNIDDAIEALQGARTVEDLNARCHRCLELIEHADAIRKRR